MSRIVAFVLAQGSNRHGGTTLEPRTGKSAPQYFDQTLPRQTLIKKENNVTIKAYHPHVLLCEITEVVKDPFSEESFRLRERLIERCHQILQEHGARTEMSEEYAVAVVDGYDGEPNQFFSEAPAIARFLKSEMLPLDPDEIDRTVGNGLKYAKDDLVLVDWDGAVLFDTAGKTEAEIELLELCNLQLLLYRILGESLDFRLRKLERLMGTKTLRHAFFWNREIAKAYRQVIRARTESIVEFEATTRDTKLIGDWYSARLYEMTAKKLRLDDWRRSIRDKLSSLEEVSSIISNHFRVSKQYFLEAALLIGWFTLLLADFAQYVLGR